MKYTRLGTALWDWRPFYSLAPTERCLWLSLYTSSHAKQSPPGLFYGGLAVVSEMARMGASDVISGIGVLAERKLVEHDEEARLMRLTQLPDQGERPSNGNALKRFWEQWKQLPESPLKYRHIPTLEWLCSPMSEGHRHAWSVTFGTVDPHLVNTSLDQSSYWRGESQSRTNSRPHEQRPLFSVISGSRQDGTQRSDDGALTVPPSAWYTESGIGPDTHTVTVKTPSEDYSSHFSQAADRDTGTRRGELPPSFTVADLFEALDETADGRIALDIYDERIGHRLWDVIRQCDKQRLGIQDVELAGEWLAAGGLGYRDDLDAKWLSHEGNLIGLIAKARKWHDAGRPNLDRKRSRGGSSSFDRQAKRLAHLRSVESAT